MPKLFIVKCVKPEAGDIQRMKYDKLISLLVADDCEFRVNKFVTWEHTDTTGRTDKAYDYEVTVKDFNNENPPAQKYIGTFDLLYDGRWEDHDMNEHLHNEGLWFFNYERRY